jgi:hypothetical protein
VARPVLDGGRVTDSYNQALNEQLKSNIWQRTQEAVTNMSAVEKTGLVADVAGIFDPTPVSDTVGLAVAIAQGDPIGALASLGSMVPYVGDAVAKPLKIARKAPKVAEAIEAALKAGDKLATSGKAALKEAGLTLEQVAAARKKALETVQQAMVDVKRKLTNCKECNLVDAEGKAKGVLQLPRNGPAGKWKGGAQPADGNGVFQFSEKKILPNGDEVAEIEFKNGAPDFSKYTLDGKHELWEVTGKVSTDERALETLMREKNPSWSPPSTDQYTLHHFEDGTVGYVPNVIHDRTIGGAAHSGGNSMVNNKLF